MFKNLYNIYLYIINLGEWKIKMNWTWDWDSVSLSMQTIYTRLGGDTPNQLQLILYNYISAISYIYES